MVARSHAVVAPPTLIRVRQRWASRAYTAAKTAVPAKAGKPVRALASRNAGPWSIATKANAGPAEIGRVSIIAPRNGPTRSTSAETATTMAAVASILARRPTQNGSDSPGSIPQIAPCRWFGPTAVSVDVIILGCAMLRIMVPSEKRIVARASLQRGHGRRQIDRRFHVSHQPDGALRRPGAALDRLGAQGRALVRAGVGPDVRDARPAIEAIQRRHELRNLRARGELFRPPFEGRAEPPILQDVTADLVDRAERAGFDGRQARKGIVGLQLEAGHEVAAAEGIAAPQGAVALAQKLRVIGEAAQHRNRVQIADIREPAAQKLAARSGL